MTEPLHRNGYACLPRQEFSVGNRKLRPVLPDDIESIRVWRNAQQRVLRQAGPLSAEQQRRYYETTVWPAMASARPPNILLAYLVADRLVGYGGLVHIAWEHHRAEVSFLMDPKRGETTDEYAADFREFLSMLKEVAFKALTLNRIFTETYVVRTSHIAVLESAGFRLEGRLLEHVMIDGNPIDSVIHGYLRSYEG